MKNYFDFIMYLAFRNILMHENKRSLTLEQLHNFRVKICEKDIESYARYDYIVDEDFEENLRYFHTTNMNMTFEEEKANFLKFLEENNEFFTYKHGVISLKDDVSYDELENASFELDSYSTRDDVLICGGLIGIFDRIECLETLEAYTIRNYVSKIIDVEKKIESAYHTYSGNNLKENIVDLLPFVDRKLSVIGNLDDCKMTYYHRIILNSGIVDPENKGQDINLLSDYLKDNDEFYKMHFKYIDFILNMGFQNAIFNTGTLVYNRLNEYLDMMWNYREPDAEMEIEPIDSEAFAERMQERKEELEAFEDEFEDDEESDDYDDEDDMNQVEYYLHQKNINMAFHLNYINNVNAILNVYGPNEKLETVKTRLLYLLDAYGDNLYIEENFDNMLKNISNEEFDYKEDFSDFYMLSRLFLVDVLEGNANDDLTLRKIIYASTYYDLTKDERIERIIDKYKKIENAQRVISCVMNNDYEGLIEASSDKPKQMIKKDTNKNDKK